VHVGGTNGKGSTSAFLAAMLRASGHRVGLYTSPHLVSLGERVTVDGQQVSEAALTAWAARLEPLALELNASFFEITTAIAFADLAARGAEIAVIEVGLGGRLDATNVIDPLAAGVTRIALEHTEYLGHDLAGIAREKAGIAKPGVPFLTTETDASLVTAMAETAEDRGTRLQRVDPTLAEGQRLGLRGPHQVANASLAIALAESLPAQWRPMPEAIQAGLARASVPGRFDRQGRYIFDVAHNPDGMRALVAALAEAAPPRPIIVVFGVLKDKDADAMLAMLKPVVDRIILTTPPSSPADRRWARGETDFDEALREAAAAGGTVLVTGSFHTVGDAMARLPGYSQVS
jgi:dihydrofolate synthase/folylpolyglutamate synthase